MLSSHDDAYLDKSDKSWRNLLFASEPIPASVSLCASGESLANSRRKTRPCITLARHSQPAIHPCTTESISLPSQPKSASTFYSQEVTNTPPYPRQIQILLATPAFLTLMGRMGCISPACTPILHPLDRMTHLPFISGGGIRQKEVCFTMNQWVCDIFKPLGGPRSSVCGGRLIHTLVSVMFTIKGRQRGRIRMKTSHSRFALSKKSTQKIIVNSDTISARA